MLPMCIDIECVGTGESMFCSLFVLSDGALVHGRIIYVL